MHLTKNLTVALLALLFVMATPGISSAERTADGDKAAGEKQTDRSERKRNADGDGEKRERGEKGERKGHPLFKGIELSEEQKQAVKEIHKSRADERDEIRAEMKAARENEDREAGKAAMEKLHAFMQEGAKLIRAELTKEQRAQFDENLEKLKEKREKHAGEGKRGEGEDGDKPKRERGEKKGGKKGGDKPAENNENLDI